MTSLASEKEKLIDNDDLTPKIKSTFVYIEDQNNAASATSATLPRSPSFDINIPWLGPTPPSLLKNICIKLRIRYRTFRWVLLALTLIALYIFSCMGSSIVSSSSSIDPTNSTAPTQIRKQLKSIYNGTTHQPGWSWDRNEKCKLDPVYNLGESKIASAKKGWQDFLESIRPRIEQATASKNNSNSVKSRGIVYTGHSNVLKQFILSVKMLRKHSCILPIEFWHFDEITNREAELISSLGNVTVRNMKLIKDSPLKLQKEDGRMWEMKGASILHSSFDQVLFLDTDNVPARDPTVLFDSQPFKETGAVFWKDFGKLGRNNAIWSILDIPCTDEFEQESGQVLIDKSRPDSLKAMYLAAYMQQERKLYFELFWGDKETFRLAWRAVKAPYHMVRPHLAAVGIQKPSISRFCGHTMVQFTPMWIPSIYGPAPMGWIEPSKPEILFMHANLFKYEHLEENGKFFPRLIRYRHPEARKNEGGAFDSKSGLCTYLQSYIEENGLTNEVIEETLDSHLPNFEMDFRELEVVTAKFIDASK